MPGSRERDGLMARGYSGAYFVLCGVALLLANLVPAMGLGENKVLTASA
jgi:hypothetical protein